MQFRGEYFFLSNFYEGKEFEYKGMKFTNGEAAFQSQKDLSRQKEFEKKRPSESKAKGRLVNLRPDWEKVKEDVMYEVCFAKFYQDKELLRKLVATGEIELVEGNYHGDRIWGRTYSQRDKAWVGENKLGKILMMIRAEFYGREI
jgi:ribA/ribD-fused uncharacterized protein